jgi:hypothetical protein
MARKLRRKAAGRVAAKVVWSVPSDLPSYYVNEAEVSHSRHEFSLTVGKLPTELNAATRMAAAETGEIRIVALLQVFVPPTLIPSLIEALTDHKNQYEAAFSPIR